MARILVVDDEPGMVRVLEGLLRKAGHETVAASNGDDALEVFRRQHPDVMLTDIYMPGKEGVRLIQEVRALNPAVGIIALTGQPQAPQSNHIFSGGRMDALEVATRMGADESLRKPVEFEELIDTVLAVLALGRRRAKDD